MTIENDFLPFCGTDTGTNLEEQAAYLADPNRLIGNQPGIASSKFNNKAIRQGTFIASQLAQYVANQTGANVLDDGVTANFFAQLSAAIEPLPTIYSFLTSGSGTYNASFVFFLSPTGSASSGATYTNNGVTYTVSATVASAGQVIMTGNGAPLVQGTLTKASGTGDATITFLAVRAPVSYKIFAVGGGGGGSGSGSGAGNGGAGGNTTFGTSLIVANGGNGGILASGVSGGSASLGGLSGISGTGNSGGVYGGGAANFAGNYGAGGGGAASATFSATGGWGGAGGNVEAVINSSLLYSYPYAAGAAGTLGTNGSGGANGAPGISGALIIEARY